MTEEREVEIQDVLQQRQERFDEEQRSAITSTDVAKILQLTRWGSPLSVYRRKRGETDPRPQGLPAWLGLKMEGVVAELFTGATDLRLRNDERFYRHPTFMWLGTHLDRRVVGDPRVIVELKTRNSTRGWGADGTGDIPPDVWCQVQTQLFVVNGAYVLVAALFANSDFRVYRVEPDPAYEKDILPTLEEFWFENVQKGVPPLATGLDVDDAYLRSLGGGNTGEIKAATPEQESLVVRYRLAKYNAAQAVFAELTAKNQIIAIIGAADGIRGTFGSITFKRSRDSVKPHWDKIAGVYHRATEQLLDIINPGDDEALVQQLALIQAQVDTAEGMYTDIQPGSRRWYADLVEEP